MRSIYKSHAVRALDFSFEIFSRDPVVISFMEAALGAFERYPSEPAHHYWVVDSPGGEFLSYSLWLDGTLLGKTGNLNSLLQVLLSDLNQQIVKFSGKYLLIHAAAVSSADCGMLLPAPHNSGKSTLAAGLVSNGWKYLSDEIAAIDFETLKILPCPKSLSIGGGSKTVLASLGSRIPREILDHVDPEHEWPVPSLAIRPDSIAESCPMRVIMFPDYQPEGPTAAEEISRGDALGLLLNHCFNFDAHGRRALKLLGEMLESCSCYKLRLTNLQDACRLIETVTKN
jgi:hypothetical protein